MTRDRQKNIAGVSKGVLRIGEATPGKSAGVNTQIKFRQWGAATCTKRVVAIDVYYDKESITLSTFLGLSNFEGQFTRWEQSM